MSLLFILSSRFCDVVEMARSLAKEAEPGRGRRDLRGTRAVSTDSGRMEEEAARQRPDGQVGVEQGHRGLVALALGASTTVQATRRSPGAPCWTWSPFTNMTKRRRCRRTAGDAGATG